MIKNFYWKLTWKRIRKISKKMESKLDKNIFSVKLLNSQKYFKIIKTCTNFPNVLGMSKNVYERFKNWSTPKLQKRLIGVQKI